MAGVDERRTTAAFKKDSWMHTYSISDNEAGTLEFQNGGHPKSNESKIVSAVSLPNDSVSELPGMRFGDEGAESSRMSKTALWMAHTDQFQPYVDRQMEDADRDCSRPNCHHFETAASTASATVTTPKSQSRHCIEKGSVDSIVSFETKATSIGAIPPLQETDTFASKDKLESLTEDDPGSFDLVAPQQHQAKEYSLEARAERILSKEHLQAILSDPALLNQFTAFLSTYRSKSMQLLIYYLDALKAVRAISYSNAIAEALDPIAGLDFTLHAISPTVNPGLVEKVRRALDQLTQEELPSYVSYIWVQIVRLNVRMRITGALPRSSREVTEGLAETFCLTDPSRKDHPIIFASEEFHRTTQYGVNYAIGRNCRFLQGPRTDAYSVKRLGKAIHEGRETTELILNYRRDGSTFLNLLMIAPLMDNKGKIRYFIGSQVDVSGLAKDCTDLPALQHMLVEEAKAEQHREGEKNEFLMLSEMFNQSELETAQKTGGCMHRGQVNDDDTTSTYHQPRLVIKDISPRLDSGPDGLDKDKINGKLAGIYDYYLLVRPYPSLRILFTSPTLRVPGILQSVFMDRIGGSARVCEELAQALIAGRGVTAKVLWLSSPQTGEEGRSRWIHCTPLLDQNGRVGVWMVVLVDGSGGATTRRFRAPPPVARQIGSSERCPNANSVSMGRLEPRSPASCRPSGLQLSCACRVGLAPHVRRSHATTRGSGGKFEQTLTEYEFDRQIEERDHMIVDQAGSTAASHLAGTAGSNDADSVDSFQIR